MQRSLFANSSDKHVYPFSFMHSVFTQLGFYSSEGNGDAGYRFTLKDDIHLVIPFHSADQEAATVDWGNAYITDNPNDEVAYNDAIIRWEETKEAFARKSEDYEKMKLADNSSLAQNESELVQLGKDMDSMKTNEQLRARGVISDPIQS
ncbi:hypothetical protein SY83_19435 [Paenibacillus swuensis]|uniref:Uncharacterized protein n=1 Tax=Paenibacillus swuensis TaxID=1178515 RepID=A0A172TM37_9BACL|nr:hypothetical protein [Paenibacillus swuensis]ANE48098.1 hypothetical protein SY83_19435 [Paenibacillus swuensis]